jgi:hypothetical protein
MPSPVSVRQIRTVESADVKVTSVESCEKAIERTSSLWPVSFCISSPVSIRQIRTVESADAEATSVKSYEKATERT